MLFGLSFYGTGAAAPTAHNATMKDCVLEATVTTLAERGARKENRIMGISFSSDAPALGSKLELRIGNSPLPGHVHTVFPGQDADLVTEPNNLLNYYNLGGIPVNENELIDIRLYDPGAAELMAGVVWIEDGEPEIPIPNGRIIYLLIATGANDGATTLSTTGFDMTTVKLQDNAIYTPFRAVVRPEDKVIQWCLIRAGKDAMALPPCGRMDFPTAPLQFTGRQFNSSQVIGKIQVQAATKAEILLGLVETFPTGPGPGEVAIVGTGVPKPQNDVILGAGGAIQARPVGNVATSTFSALRF